MSAVLFVLLAATGVLMIFVYEPSPGLAHDSIMRMQSDIFFGKLVRSVHHWSANLLIALVFLHLLRVYFTGAYYGPRQFNWVIGLVLLACVLASNFTGYLMPWDQLSYWAITIVTGMIGYVPGVGSWLQQAARGGPEIGTTTLITYYAAHTTVLPVLIVLIMAWHFWRVRRAHGVVIPRAPDEELDRRGDTILALPHLLLRELVVALILVAFVMVIAVAFSAPLGAAANPGMSPNPAKAPWYFVGFQELLLHFHPTVAVVLIPSLATVGLLLIPYLKYDTDTSGVFMMSHKGRRMAAIAAATATVLTPFWIVLDEYWIDFPAWLPGLPALISGGLVPALILFAGTLAFYVGLKRWFSATNNEAVQALFVLLTVAFVILTITGVWFRGSGMGLVWP
jgi:quinol-cytochrome oxidoreductase complex cytochrome b subunit